ncbi:MAG TPA: hypothetical protein VGD40_18870 [Chryseosolibacter sp.]
MDAATFIQNGFHNRHIRFEIDGKVFSGVVVDDPNHKEGKSKRTDYTFIPTRHMKEWHSYQKENNKGKMYSLSSVIDIALITRAELI